MPRNRFFATLMVLAGCAAVIFIARAWKPSADRLLSSRIAERSVGSEKAPLWITEYFDYQCPPCARASKILEEEMTKRPDQIYLQLRYFPLPAHKNAMKAAIYAECASRQKGKFLKFHKELFENQEKWAPDPYPQVHFANYAEKAGLDLRRLDSCAHDPSTEKAIVDEKKKGEELDVKITPSFFVDGKLTVGTNGLQEAIKAYFEKKAE